MLGLAALIAAITAVAGIALDFVSKSEYSDNDKHTGATITAGIATFVVSLFASWGILFWTLPIFTGGGWMLLICTNLLVALVAFGIANFAGERISLAPVVSLLTIIVLLLGFGGIWQGWWYGQDNVDTMKSKITVTIASDQDGTKNYPKTDEAHIPQVGDQAARFRANQVMNNPGIGSRYVLGDGELQAIKGHLYYVFDLRTRDLTTTKQVQYTVPGYILVDAEDPNAEPQPKLGYKITLWKDGFFESHLERHIWENGYSSYYLDGLSLEVDDDGNPFYTATINKPVIRWDKDVPVGFITVNAQSGKIVRYELDRIPAWVDRVYSETTAHALITWWGRWGQAPYKGVNEGAINRFKISGHLNIVYTEQGPAYQALLTSYNSDTAVQYVVLMPTRNNKAVAYRAPQGLLIESSVENSFNKAPNNLKKQDPTVLTLHKIYGQLTWVASMVGDGEGNQTDDSGYPKPASFGGIGILHATQSDANKVILGKDMGDALSQYSTQIATGANNTDPNATAQTKTVEGKIASVSPPLVFNGNTFVILALEGDKDHLYRGQVIESQASSLAMTVTKPGDTVIITYVDTNNPIRNISGFTNNSLVGIK